MTRSISEMRFDAEEPFRLIGCLLVFPAGAIGALMILDYPGPPGPLGFTEILGWGALSVSLGVLTGRLLAAFFERRSRWLALLGSLAIPAAFSFLLWNEIQPRTPAIVKDIVEYALQALGIMAIAGSAVFFVRSWRRSRSPDLPEVQ
jgi:hypothetical protein